jgi:antitoxin YefM
MCNNLYNMKEAAMVDVTTYSEARQNLAKLLDRVVKDNEPVIVARKKRGSVVLVALSEWNSIQETLHLSSTRANARALLDAMDEADRGEYAKTMTMKELRAFVQGAKQKPAGRAPRKKVAARSRKRVAKASREAAE